MICQVGISQDRQCCRQSAQEVPCRVRLRNSVKLRNSVSPVAAVLPVDVGWSVLPRVAEGAPSVLWAQGISSRVLGVIIAPPDLPMIPVGGWTYCIINNIPFV